MEREATQESRQYDCFLDAVAVVYETGLAVPLAGLFAGESRRRESLPDCPFERRRHRIRSQEPSTRVPN